MEGRERRATTAVSNSAQSANCESLHAPLCASMVGREAALALRAVGCSLRIVAVEGGRAVSDAIRGQIHAIGERGEGRGPAEQGANRGTDGGAGVKRRSNADTRADI